MVTLVARADGVAVADTEVDTAEEITPDQDNTTTDLAAVAVNQATTNRMVIQMADVSYKK